MIRTVLKSQRCILDVLPDICSICYKLPSQVLHVCEVLARHCPSLQSNTVDARFHRAVDKMSNAIYACRQLLEVMTCHQYLSWPELGRNIIEDKRHVLRSFIYSPC